MLRIRSLHISIENKPIVNGVSLDIKPGEVHAIMGPNGSGKSTLANALMGHPRYVITKGIVELDDEVIHELPVHERARRGLFLAFQYPMEIPGVSVLNFLRSAQKALHPTEENKKISHPGLERRSSSFRAFQGELQKEVHRVGLGVHVVERSLNEGFSGGEKKKMEIVQASILHPTYIILDEIDSGLDIDALKQVAASAVALQRQGKGLLVITHYARLLHHLLPDAVHVMVNGAIVQSGDASLAHTIEEKGYQHFTH